ncbi:hypothetical protein [Pseudomonas sp. EpS/L25]|uniref:hypothetical protein n=1 Tax=Pseudomonas sp. EpS/L25 TaxID=1749078 RepID=UPI000743B05E|nr:hypothetical protein [Pseudomonas sp. EpS/L25]KUM43642.1 hypothetical protein AR540_17790 [Pseudomonas sp. EpS/L25]
MSIEDEERGRRLKEVDGLSATTVMDRARVDPDFMSRVILALEECGVDDRTDEEHVLLEWARSFQRQRGFRAD